MILLRRYDCVLMIFNEKKDIYETPAFGHIQFSIFKNIFYLSK